MAGRMLGTTALAACCLLVCVDRARSAVNCPQATFQCGSGSVCCPDHETCWADVTAHTASCHSGNFMPNLTATSTLQEFHVLSHSPNTRFTLNVTGQPSTFSAASLSLRDPDLKVSFENGGCGRSITKWIPGGNLTIQCVSYCEPHSPWQAKEYSYSFSDPVALTFRLLSLPNITLELYPDSPSIQVPLDQVVVFNVIPPRGRNWYPLPGINLLGSPGSPSSGSFGVCSGEFGNPANYYNLSNTWALNIPQKDPSDLFLRGETMIVPFIHDLPQPKAMAKVVVKPFARIDPSKGTGIEAYTAEIGGPLYFDDYLSVNPNTYTVPSSLVVSSRFNSTWMPKKGLQVLARLVSSSYRDPEGCIIRTHLPYTDGERILNISHPVASIPAHYYTSTPKEQGEAETVSVGVTLGFMAPPGYNAATEGSCQMLFSWNVAPTE